MPRSRLAPHTTSGGWSREAPRRRICSHGPVLPELLMALLALVDPDEPEADLAAAVLRAAARDKMGKGEVLVAHLVGSGDEARLVAVERHLPPS